MSDQQSLPMPLDPAGIAREHIGNRIVVASVSGGRDSTAMSLYLTERGIEHRRMFMDTGWEHPATYEYLRGPLTKALGPIEETRGELDFLGLVKKKGLFPSRVMRFCTTELKVFPAQRFINALVEREGRDAINAVGIRRAESKARSQMAEWEWSETFDVEIWRPLVTWTREDVDAIHKRHGIEPNPLYGMGATRVGCWPCIHARKGEIALVADVDPGRIEQIAELEQALSESGRDRDRERGLDFVPRSMFSYGGGGRKHIPITMREAVDWARSGRGEWQPPGASDGCVRFGVCSTEEES